MRHVIFGESHGPAIGVVLEGVPAGLELDWEFISREMARRAPGKDPTATARREADVPRVLSGVFEGRATGTPLCAVIENTDTRSGDYANLKNVTFSNMCDISLHMDSRMNRLIVVSTIDNMVKGAAGQAIQNMNLICGLPEDTGLKLVPPAF